ncbi:MAG: cytochrome c [Sphingobacteriia bacterium]|nr:cytochrome c [Sphingobacteriia bacterium]NCC41453.1 cytochrome c [Gammaproteobacteria bacterium]
MLPLLVVLALGGCAEESGVGVPVMPRFDDARLALGRTVWMGHCRACHLLGVGGTAPMSDPTKLAAHLARPRAVLEQSLIRGMTGETGRVLMPPRAGNPSLTDLELHAALEYHLAALGALHPAPRP